MTTQSESATAHGNTERAATRTEHDSLGDVEVPADARWGPQTQRAVTNFAVGTEVFPRAFVRALATVKKACALANGELGVLDLHKVDAIVRATDEILDGAHDDQFPLRIWQSGSGTQTNMNMNEVIAHITGLHPNDDVNRCQSTNDVFPTTMHVAVAEQMQRALIPAVTQLRDTLRALSARVDDVTKIGRTHMMDAVPLSLGQEVSGWAAQLDIALEFLDVPRLYELASGGTAVGTGLNAPRDFGVVVARHVAQLTGLPFSSAPNKFAAIASHDTLVFVHGALRTLAVALLKIVNDVRLLASGPRAGLGELMLPANEPGSSAMPGKVNPTQCEMLSMICMQVFGNDVAVTMAGASGHLELNAFKPVIVHNVLTSIRLLTDGVRAFDVHCARGIEPNRERIHELVERSLMLVTALVPRVGYDSAAKIALKAHREGLTLREAARALGVLDDTELETLLDVERLVPH